MSPSENCYNLIKKYEGCRLVAYLDPVGIPTIGYGHTKGVKLGDKISMATADEYLKQDAYVAERAVDKWDRKYQFTQGQYDALVSFTFNCGTANLNKLVKNGLRSKKAIGSAIVKYNKAGGKVLRGLERRRKAEQVLYNS